RSCRTCGASAGSTVPIPRNPRNVDAIRAQKRLLKVPADNPIDPSIVTVRPRDRMHPMIRPLRSFLLFARCALTAADEKTDDSASDCQGQYAQRDGYVQAETGRSPQIRAERWHLNFSSPAAYQKAIELYRNQWIEMLGVPPNYSGAFEEKRVRVADTPNY